MRVHAVRTAKDLIFVKIKENLIEKEGNKFVSRKMQKRYGTRDSEVIPDLRTNRAWRRLACKFEMGLRASDCTLAVSVSHFSFSNSHSLRPRHLIGDISTFPIPPLLLCIIFSLLFFAPFFYRLSSFSLSDFLSF